MKKKNGSHPGYNKSPRFQVDLAGHPGLIGPIVSLSFCELKLNQGPKLLRSGQVS